MKTIVILGAGQMGKAACNLLNPNSIEVVAFGDNNPDTWNDDSEIPVLPVADALMINPDLVLIGVLDAERGAQLKSQLFELGYRGDMLSLGELYSSFDIRSATLKRIARRIREGCVEGVIAELGVYRGDFAWQLNELFPERRLYLFDTFNGFHEQDVQTERQVGASLAQVADFSDTRETDVLARMPFEEQVIVMKGRFPETAQGIDERFALVSIDVDLYAPTLAGLEYFYPRLNQGGIIMLHDYNSHRFDGVKKAVQFYEEKYGELPMIPLSDLHGTAAIIRS